MAAFIKMTQWNPKIEEEITLLVKDWLKQTGHTQADLKDSLNSSSSRMQSIVEKLKQAHLSGGMIQIARLLCEVEESWTTSLNSSPGTEKSTQIDPYGQLDLLLEEIKEDCDK